jgi:hypothetical protein
MQFLANKGLPLGARATFSLGVAAGIQKDNRQQQRNQKGADETDPVRKEDEYFRYGQLGGTSDRPE